MHQAATRGMIEGTAGFRDHWTRRRLYRGTSGPRGDAKVPVWVGTRATAEGLTGRQRKGQETVFVSLSPGIRILNRALRSVAVVDLGSSALPAGVTLSQGPQSLGGAHVTVTALAHGQPPRHICGMHSVAAYPPSRNPRLAAIETLARPLTI